MISNGSSVEAFCIVASSIVLTFLFIMAKWRYKENPFKFLLKKQFMVQALSRGISSVLISFAYIFAPASSIAGGRRGVAVLAGILSGKAFFNEKHILIKITSFILVVAGLILLMV
jgi:multidrug transporter EmrE-like cation transporter